VVSREVARRIHGPYFNWELETEKRRKTATLLDKGEILGIFVVPPDFQKRLFQGKIASIQLLMDGTQITSSTLASAYIAQILSSYSQEFALRHYGMPSHTLDNMPSVESRIRILFNPNLEDSYFSALDELFMVITMISIILSATALVRERDYGTMEQLLVSPMKPREVIGAKILFTIITLLLFTQVTVFLILQWEFRIPMRGSHLLFTLVTALYIFSSCGIGLLIATMARRLGHIGLLTILFLAPILFLSGGWVPSEAMPSWMVPLTFLSPLKYYTDFGLGIYLRGEGLALAWRQMLALSLVGGGCFMYGLFRFKKSYH